MTDQTSGGVHKRQVKQHSLREYSDSSDDYDYEDDLAKHPSKHVNKKAQQKANEKAQQRMQHQAQKAPSTSTAKPGRHQSNASQSSSQQQQQQASSASSKGAGTLAEIKETCMHILQQLKKHEYAAPFLSRVDTMQQPQFADYYDIVKDPIDFQKIEANLKAGVYTSVLHFKSDINKVWANSFLYNKPNTQLYQMTVQIQGYFESICAMGKTASSSSAPKPINQQTQLQGQQGIVNNMNTTTNNMIPLSDKEKAFIYNNVQHLSNEDTSNLCAIIRDFCPINNDSLELNLDVLPVAKTRELYNFLTRIRKSQETNYQQNNLLTSEFQNNAAVASTVNEYSNNINQDTSNAATAATGGAKGKKKRLGKIDKMDTPMAMNEKNLLAQNISNLSSEDQIGIQAFLPDTLQKGEVIEFNIDTLSVRKLRELEAYVKEKMQNSKKSKNSKNAGSSTSSTAANVPSAAAAVAAAATATMPYSDLTTAMNQQQLQQAYQQQSPLMKQQQQQQQQLHSQQLSQQQQQQQQQQQHTTQHTTYGIGQLPPPPAYTNNNYMQFSQQAHGGYSHHHQQQQQQQQQQQSQQQQQQQQMNQNGNGSQAAAAVAAATGYPNSLMMQQFQTYSIPSQMGYRQPYQNGGVDQAQNALQAQQFASQFAAVNSPYQSYANSQQMYMQSPHNTAAAAAAAANGNGNMSMAGMYGQLQQQGGNYYAQQSHQQQHQQHQQQTHTPYQHGHYMQQQMMPQNYNNNNGNNNYSNMLKQNQSSSATTTTNAGKVQQAAGHTSDENSASDDD